MPEPTMTDIFNLLQNCASKQDTNDIKSQIACFTNETNEKIEAIQRKVDTANTACTENTDKIEINVEATIESLKQDQLKNNKCISGVPPEMIKNGNTSDILIEIAKKLNVEFTKSQITSYAVARNKFIIVQFHNHMHKQKRVLWLKKCSK